MPADIVYIDDEPQDLIAAARVARAGSRFAEYVPPDLEGAEEAAAVANLWVFDFFNDNDERRNPGLRHFESNGLSVFQQFRLLVGDARPPAVVVSNHLEEALGIEVNLERRHIIAEQVGVEWVAPKLLGEGNVIPELLALADGVARLRSISARLTAADPLEYVAELARSALELPKNVEWAPAAVSDVAAWRPPAWIESAPDHRIALLQQKLPVQIDLRSARSMVAWMLRQALPYPSFIVRDRHIAVRLGLSLGCVRAATASRTPLAKSLNRAVYKGTLAGFGGTRWWSAGIDALAWSLPRQKDARIETLEKLVAPVELEELALVDPVVVSDGDLIETDDIAPAAECVRAADDHFPPHAPPAWVRIEDARRDRVLARRVKLQDQAELAIQP